MLLNQVHEKSLSPVQKSTVGSLEIILGQENTKSKYRLSKTKIDKMCWVFFFPQGKPDFQADKMI